MGKKSKSFGGFKIAVCPNSSLVLVLEAAVPEVKTSRCDAQRQNDDTVSVLVARDSCQETAPMCWRPSPSR